MTTQSDPPAAASSKPRSHWFTLAIIALLAVVVLWSFGVFKSRPKVALITSGDTPFWEPVITGANEAAKIYDVDLTVVKSKSSLEQQTAEIQNVLGRHFDGVAISPISPTGQAAALSSVADATTLVTFDSDSPMSRRLCFVGTDNYAAGRLAGKQVRDALPDGGEVIICVGNLDKENTQHRRQGVIDELLDRSYEPDRAMDDLEAPAKDAEGKYVVVATLVDNSDPQKATELAADALKSHPNVKAFVGLLAYSANSILKALEPANKVGQIKVVAFDAEPATLDGIEKHAVVSSIMQDQYGLGFHAVRILAEAARGDRAGGLPMFQRRTLPCEIITYDNVGVVREQLKRVRDGGGGGAAASSVASSGAAPAATQPGQ